jgi:hypothetical protein
LIGVGGFGSQYRPSIYASPLPTSGALITLPGQLSRIQGFYCRAINLTGLSGNVSVISAVGGATISNCSVVVGNNDATYEAYCVSGQAFIEYSNLQDFGGTGVRTAAKFTAASQIKYSWIYGPDAGTTKYFVQNTAGNTTLFFVRFGTAAGVMAATADIQVDGGAVYANNSTYKTYSGSVTHIDLATTTVPGMAKKIAAVADLNQTITNPPTQAEVQAISDKIDEFLGAARTAGVLAT